MNIILQGDDYFVSFSFLLEQGIKEDTVRYWRRAVSKGGEWETIKGIDYVRYNTIPAQTLSKLPSEKKLQNLYESQKVVKRIFENIQQAYAFAFSDFIPLYKDISGIKPEKVNEAAKFHAVYDCLLTRRKTEKVNDLLNEYEAFNRLLPGVSGSKHDFSRKIKKCVDSGIEKVAFDTRSLGNHNEDTTKIVDAAARLFIWKMTADPNKFSAPEILEKLTADCQSRDVKAPKLGRVQQIHKEALADYHVKISRYGEQETRKDKPSASLNKPIYANMLHMIDGWKVPAYHDANTGNKSKDGWQGLTLVYVMDVATKKILGGKMGSHETGEEIRDALRSSVRMTGVVPYQMVMDKHTWTRTQEYSNIKKVYDTKGCTVIETINPQEKSDIERQHRILDKLYKKWLKEWHGGGIQARDKETRIKKEAVKKSKLTADELITATAAVIVEWNKRPGKDGLSPNQRYEAYPCPRPLEVDMFGQALLFIRQGDYKVTRNEIEITRNHVEHKFLLPGKLWGTWNNKTVLVTWEDLTDCIYVFDPFTKNPIATVKPKDLINADIASQTEEDKKKFGKHEGVIKSIVSNSAKKWETMNTKAEGIADDVHGRIDRARTSKDLVREMEGDPNIREYAEMFGADTTKVYSKPQTPHELPEVMYPAKKRDDQVFTPKNHTMREIDPDELFNDI